MKGVRDTCSMSLYRVMVVEVMVGTEGFDKKLSMKYGVPY